MHLPLSPCLRASVVQDPYPLQSTHGAEDALGGERPGAAPGAYGVVVRSVTAEGSPAAADGFALPIDTPEQTSFTFSPSGGRCQPSRPGNVASHGQDVEVLFVDAVGRTSEAVAVRVR